MQLNLQPVKTMRSGGKAKGVITTWKVFRISDKELVLKLDYPNTSEHYFFESTKAE